MEAKGFILAPSGGPVHRPSSHRSERQVAVPPPWFVRIPRSFVTSLGIGVHFAELANSDILFDDH